MGSSSSDRVLSTSTAPASIAATPQEHSEMSILDVAKRRILVVEDEMLVALLLHDMLIPLIWLRAWTANAYKWGGHQVAWESGGSASMSNESIPNESIVGLR